MFAVLLAALLEEIDQQLAEARDKRRYQLKDMRVRKRLRYPFLKMVY
ncbi:hypothetical protein B9L19_17045 [Geobacillus thermocatenulatus]|uniref:Uncharacterized protein n=1 Tax=Geobacillus thermocatenulatus TaxID=33938 RepID=A0AA91QN90_9BACL|nr:hypothetical protein B9L19_17045 [Geobacillus thermocatenulatus]